MSTQTVALGDSSPTGFQAGAGGLTVGHQFGLATSFHRSGYNNYNLSTPVVAAGVTTTTDGTFAGSFISMEGKLGFSAGPSRTCIWGTPKSGC